MQRITPAQKIKQIREQKRMTQEELAEKLHVSIGTIKNWENGVSEPGISVAEDLAKALNVDIANLHSTSLAEERQNVENQIYWDEEIKKFTQQLTKERFALAEAWIKKHPERMFKQGFNQFNYDFCRSADETSIRYIYGDEFVNGICFSISTVSVIVRRLRANNYILTRGHLNLESGVECEVFLRSQQEAKTFTRDLAIALAMPVILDDPIEGSLCQDFYEVLKEANQKMSEMLTRAVYDTRRPKYVVRVFEPDDAAEHIFVAVDNKDLAKKMDIIKPKKYLINQYNETDSKKICEKIRAKISK